MEETLMYATKINEPDYMEELVYECKGYTNMKQLKERGVKWAKNNGYNRVRVTTIDLSLAPDFIGSINKQY